MEEIIKKLKEYTIEQLQNYSDWTDNGEKREYVDISKEKATEIANDIFDDWEGLKVENSSTKALDIAGVNGSAKQCQHSRGGALKRCITIGCNMCEHYR